MNGEDWKWKALILLFGTASFRVFKFGLSPPELQSLQNESLVWSVHDLALSQGKAQGGLMYSRNPCDSSRYLVRCYPWLTIRS